jgi:hypothetical protein
VTSRAFTAFVDTVVAPAPLLPPVEETDAARFLDEWLDRAPRLNALALRAALQALDLAPFASRHRRRFHALPQSERAAYLKRLERSRLRVATKALKGIAFLCYYGDDGLMKRLGYDADANVARARRIRATEGRP